MNDAHLWQPLIDELERWEAEGRTAQFWLRDDDAVTPTAALERLLSLSRTHQVPVTLAVIPAFAEPVLAARLKAESSVRVTVHGWSHENHAPKTEKKQELGAHRPAETVLAELGAGLEKLRDLFADRLVPVLVPPWNRIAPDLLPALASLGFSALSVYGRAKPGLPFRLNTHIDVMDWHGTRGGQDHALLVAQLAGQLRQRAVDDDEPIGVLTHHLVHDEKAWDFLDALFGHTVGHPAVRWRSIADLLPE